MKNNTHQTNTNLVSLHDRCFRFLTSQMAVTHVQKQSPSGVLKKVSLKNFAKFTTPVAQSRLQRWKRKRLWHRCFPVNFANFLRTSFFIDHLRWLLLHVLRKQCSIKIDGRLKKAVPQSNCSSITVKIVYFCITEAVAWKSWV